MEPEVDEIWWQVTCHTVGCENEGIAIPVVAVGDPPLVACGPCVTPIEDIVALPPDFLGD